MSRLYDFAIVGGGIVGLSTACALTERYPHASVLILEKESAWAEHQTGHNSGVIHSGIYYKPGSFKASFCRAGNRSMVAFCRTHDIAHEICGKVIVATNERELPLLENLYQRGVENQLRVTRISPAELREIEPHVHGLAAIRVFDAGIVDYKEVCGTLVRLLQNSGCDLRLKHAVRAIARMQDHLDIDTPGASFTARYLVNCAGLHSDRIAALAGVESRLKIIPFRGEYFELIPERRQLVRHLVYPVPNPQFPFLGVHFTRMIGGHVEAGPNAVLALAREGYRKTDFNLRDLGEVMAFRGFWRLCGRYWKEGMQELWRSISKRAFVRSLQQLIPEIRSDDLIAAPSGIRAQALESGGALVDDFHIVRDDRCLHVYNAPSPAATASLEIGKHIASIMEPDFKPELKSSVDLY
jgi:L-2-hydroxyglutarate oxidase